jgi:hypothetical protein
MLPFNGTLMPFRVKEVSTAQILTLGNMSLIETFHDKLAKGRAPSILEMNEYAERQHALCRFAMVSPTYDEVIAQIAPGFDFAALEAELKEIRTLFLAMRDGPDKKALQDKYNIAELRYKFLLPGDFVGALLDFALSITKSEIKRVTQEVLLQAAVLATRGHDNPSDHIDKTLLKPFHILDFDNRAWVEFDRDQEAKKKKRA